MVAALEEILRSHPVWRGGALAAGVSTLATGFQALDDELPGGGWPRQAFTEILNDRPGVGELALILPALAALTRSGKRCVLVAPPHVPYAPALAAAGVDLVNLLVVEAKGRDALWAAEQALRSGGCHALAAWLAKARYAELQRLAVAAEASRAAAFLYRPLAAAHESSPACLRLALESAGADLAVHIVKRRGAPLAAPRLLPLKRPFHVVGRATSARASTGDARNARRLGLPVHA
jgi:hypothetical protein